MYNQRMRLNFLGAYTRFDNNSRGTNENTNGLIRQYFPKGTRFEDVTDEQIQDVEDKLNSRPRKRLGFKSPNQMLTKRNFCKGVAVIS